MRLVTDAEIALWAPGTVATVLGWGAAVLHGPPQAQLQQAGVPIITDDACGGAYPPRHAQPVRPADDGLCR